MKKRGLAVLLTMALAASMLTGCQGSDSGSGGGKEKVRLMVWSPSEDQSKDSGEWLQTMCENFADEHPEWDITFVYGVADEHPRQHRLRRTQKPARMYLCMQMTRSPR